jgi:hypothetical protein
VLVWKCTIKLSYGNETPAKDSEKMEITTPADHLIFSIIVLGSGLLLMWLLNKHFNHNDKNLDEYNKVMGYSENFSMDFHHTVFHDYYRKQPIGCFFIVGLVIVVGIGGVIMSIGWFLYLLIFPD